MKISLRPVIRRSPEILLGLFFLSLAIAVGAFADHVVEVLGKLLSAPEDYWAVIKNDPAPMAMGLLFLIALAGFAALVWRHRLVIWAVARQMILEALHRKVAIVLVLFFVILMPSLPFILKTDGTLKSHVQIILTYSLALAKYLLCFLAIFLTTASLSEEVEYKQIHTTDVKPVPRWTYLAGKWFGVLVLNSVLLVLMAAAVYGIVRWLARPREYPTLAQQEQMKKQFERAQVFDEVLVTRRSFRREPPDVSEEVEKEMQRLRQKDAMPEGMTPELYREQLVRQLQKQRQTVPPLTGRAWMFEGLKPSEKGRVFIRFKVEKATAGAKRSFAVGSWYFREPGTEEMIPVRSGQYPLRKHQEIWVPAALVAEDGTLVIGYRNLDPEMSVVFPRKDGMEVLQRTDPFWPNYLRSLLVILCYIALLAAIGVMAGSLFSFPVAALLASFIFVMGLISPFFQTMFTEDQFVFIKDMQMVKPGESKPVSKYVIEAVNTVAEGVARLVFAVLPGFSKYNPVGDMVTGRIVPWALVSRATFWFLLIRGGIVALLAVLLFRRRELARVQV